MSLCTFLSLVVGNREPDRLAHGLLWTFGGIAALAFFPCLSLAARMGLQFRQWREDRNRDARRVLTRGEIARYEGMFMGDR